MSGRNHRSYGASECAAHGGEVFKTSRSTRLHIAYGASECAAHGGEVFRTSRSTRPTHTPHKARNTKAPCKNSKARRKNSKARRKNSKARCKSHSLSATSHRTFPDISLQTFRYMRSFSRAREAFCLFSSARHLPNTRLHPIFTPLRAHIPRKSANFVVH